MPIFENGRLLLLLVKMQLYYVYWKKLEIDVPELLDKNYGHQN